MKWIQPELYALQSEHEMRDGRTEWNQYAPATTLLSVGYNYDLHNKAIQNAQLIIFHTCRTLSLEVTAP